MERSRKGSKKSESHRSSGRPREDEAGTSPEPVQSDFNATDNEDDDNPDSSEDLDDDIFKGKFAIKDRDEATHAVDGDRFARLPAKLKKELQNFEQEVLQSIPHGLNEFLVFTSLLVLSSTCHACRECLRSDLGKFVLILVREEMWSMDTLRDACLGFGAWASHYLQLHVPSPKVCLLLPECTTRPTASDPN